MFYPFPPNERWCDDKGRVTSQDARGQYMSTRGKGPQLTFAIYGSRVFDGIDRRKRSAVGGSMVISSAVVRFVRIRRQPSPESSTQL